METETVYVERVRTVEGESRWVPEPETLDLERDFGIDDENLEREICQMGLILVRYATIAAELEANLKRKEEFIKLAQASVSGALRSEYEKKGKKITEAKLSEEVTQNQIYQQALIDVHLLRRDSIAAERWYRSAVKKADMLNALAYRQNAEIKRAY